MTATKWWRKGDESDDKKVHKKEGMRRMVKRKAWKDEN